MLIRNKRSSYEYTQYEKFEAGMVLTGGQVKAVKSGQANISQSYVRAIGNEVYLVNASIMDKTDTIKLLLRKSEIVSILTKMKAKKLTAIPTKMYNKGRLVKLEFALARSKKQYEKRELIRRADIDRDIERELKDRK